MAIIKSCVAAVAGLVLSSCAAMQSKVSASPGLSVDASEASLVHVLPVDEAISTATAKVNSGHLVGERMGEVSVFRGVPYAQPPVGSLRWRAPQPVEPWAGYRSAVSYEPACPQPVAKNPRLPNQGGVLGPQSEDCLYLQVYAPAKADRAPVVVWLHGGGLFLGAGHLGSYVGTKNAEKGVITVSINYRLGALGYFAHPALTAEGGATGMFGVMDAVAALEWVRDNIDAFGGDPTNVTIAGQSAGGLMTVALLSTPSAEGLFQKAVVQSGAFLGDGETLEGAEAKAVEGVRSLGLSADASAADLRSISAQSFAYNAALRRGLGAVIDGEFRPTSTKAAFERNAEIDVPLIVGSNGGEGGFDRARELASKASENGAGAFLYHFDYVPAFRKAEWVNGPIHSAELMFTFDSLATSGWAMGKADASDAAVAELVSSCWVAFYKASASEDIREIQCGAGFKWPAYTKEADAVAVFDRSASVGRSADFPDGPSSGD